MKLSSTNHLIADAMFSCQRLGIFLGKCPTKQGSGRIITHTISGGKRTINNYTAINISMYLLPE